MDVEAVVMEPTIRKGEQSRDEIDQPEAVLTEVLLHQHATQPEAQPSSQLVEDHIQPLDPGEWAAGPAEFPGEQVQLQLEQAATQDIPSQADLSSQPIEDVSPQPAGELPTSTENSYLGELQTSGEISSFEQSSSPEEPTSSEAFPTSGENSYFGELHLSGQISSPEESSSSEEPHPTGEFTASVDGFEDQTSAGFEDIAALEPVRPEAEQETLSAVEPVAPVPTEFQPLPVFEEVKPVATLRKIALVLSGGGARGAFQVGAEKYAREVKGYQWDIIAGVSVGALNGAMLAMHRYTRLLELWDHISNDQVYTGGFNFVSLLKILLGAKSFYGNEPLKKLMQQEFQAGRILDDLHVGAVSLTSGEYVQFTRESLELSRAILASVSIPVVWPPVDVSTDYPAMVDGGVRNLTPIGDVLEQEPDEIVIINCGPEKIPEVPDASSNVLSIGLRSLDIMQNELFVNDLKDFLRINALVKEAEQQGAVLHHPKSGRPLKYYACQVIEPDTELGDMLDFSKSSIQAALRAGVRRARQVLGRP
jgi:NTE family protein